MIDPQVLVKLIDRLDSYPVGLPDAPGIREFLKIAFEKGKLPAMVWKILKSRFW